MSYNQNYLSSGQGAQGSGQGYQASGHGNPSYGQQGYAYTTQTGQQQPAAHGTSYYTTAYQPAQTHQSGYSTHPTSGQNYQLTYQQPYGAQGYTMQEVAPPPAPPPLEFWTVENPGSHGYTTAVSPTQQYYVSGGSGGTAATVIPYVTMDGARASSAARNATHDKQHYATALSSRQSPYQQQGYKCQRYTPKRY
ncbi:uncharacterized protein LOC135367925 [Ornithodoros turicata]|uniref:uncharacterized protein LOC135367925 n=1 Tax=Ornithodoros turicata TaxID=34597 RepID=UPI00313A185A